MQKQELYRKLILGIGTMTNVIEIRRKNRDDVPGVMHWNARRRSWRRIAWDMWFHFRSGESAIPCLTGDHYFVVCCFAPDGRTGNIHPHRYRLDEAGLIKSHDFHDLSEEEYKTFKSLNKRYYEVDKIDPLKSGYASFSEAERDTFERLRKRIWCSWLPPQEAARALLEALPNLPSNPDSGAQEFFRELGIGTTRLPVG